MEAIATKVAANALLMHMALLAPVSAATLTLANGDRLNGTIVSATTETVILQHPLLGELVLPRANVLSVDPSSHFEPAQDDIETDVVGLDPGIFATGWLTDWQKKVAVGISGASGKSESLKINAGFTAAFEDESTRWSFEAAYYRNEADGTLSDNSFRTLLNRDWLRPGSPWFNFAGGRFDWDEFQDWDYRVTGNGGVGYEFVTDERYRVMGRAGLGANQTFGDRDELTLEGLLAVDATWRISQIQSLAFTNTFHPNLEQGGEYRNLTTLDWNLDLNGAAGLGLKISLSNDYDSLAMNVPDKNDFKYTGALIWEL